MTLLFREFLLPSGQGIYHSGTLSLPYMNLSFREFIIQKISDSGNLFYHIWLYHSWNLSYHIWLYHSGNFSSPPGIIYPSLYEFLLPLRAGNFSSPPGQGIYPTLYEFLIQGIYPTLYEFLIQEISHTLYDFLLLEIPCREGRINSYRVWEIPCPDGMKNPLPGGEEKFPARREEKFPKW